MEINELQRLINNAQAIKEESWDEKKKVYGKDNKQAAIEACQAPPDRSQWSFLVYLLNQLAWNDAQNITNK